jgi:uncharacterized protein
MNFFRVLSLVILSLLPIRVTAAPQSGGVVEMKVKTIVIDPKSQTPVVVLEGIGTKEFLPIWIDVPEARAISMEIEQVKPPRPLTHDLIRNLLNRLGARINRVTITDVLNNTYIASVSLTTNGQETEMDARPSDAIAIALRMKAPIFVSLQVIEKSRPPEPAVQTDHTQRRLGVQAQELTPELAKLMDTAVARGVIITEVISGGAAMKADMQRGDIITRLNDQPVQNAGTLESLIQAVDKPGRIKVELLKKGKPTTVLVDLP